MVGLLSFCRLARKSTITEVYVQRLLSQLGYSKSELGDLKNEFPFDIRGRKRNVKMWSERESGKVLIYRGMGRKGENGKEKRNVTSGLHEGYIWWGFERRLRGVMLHRG